MVTNDLQLIILSMLLTSIRVWSSGLLPSIMGVMHVMIQFPLYEAAKEFLATKGDQDADELRPLQLVCPLAGEHHHCFSDFVPILLCWPCPSSDASLHQPALETCLAVNHWSLRVELRVYLVP
jgi:hypothetical protein